jgi:hypothetical protein
VITIPAAATSNPTKSNGKIIFMDSVLGGKQLIFDRGAGNQTFEYIIDAPAAGKYALTAKVVTPSWQQHLVITVNGSENAASIELPHTVGMWEDTKAVEIALNKGKNTLKFSRKSDGNAKGFSIKDFTLVPVK